MYTDAGGSIELRARSGASEIVRAVREDDMGISADMMPRLFTLFSQAPTALGRSEGGLGVGLALARGLVLLHGGRVEARSDGPGRGSEFIVRLPVGVAASEASQVEVRADGPATDAGLKILVVDDSQ